MTHGAVPEDRRALLAELPLTAQVLFQPAQMGLLPLLVVQASPFLEEAAMHQTPCIFGYLC